MVDCVCFCIRCCNSCDIPSICPLFFALWRISDLLLVMVQTYNYYKYGFDTNKTTASDYFHANLTMSSNMNAISPLYFDFSVGIWMCPAIFIVGTIIKHQLQSLIAAIKHDESRNGFSNSDDIATCGVFWMSRFVLTNNLFNYFGINLGTLYCGRCLKIGIILLFLPLNMLAASTYMYILIPLASLQYGILAITKCNAERENTHIPKINLLGKRITNRAVLCIVLFGIIVQCLPHLILTSIFAGKNHDNPLSTTTISICFSVGSICMSLCSGFKILVDGIDSGLAKTDSDDYESDYFGVDEYED